MIAYHGSEEAKLQILAQLDAHRRADEIVRGQYWDSGKGCAVGCTVHSSNHAEYEPRFGIPIMLAWIEDLIFEGLPNGEAKDWPGRFMDAIPVGADLSRVGWQFLHWLLTDKAVNPGIDHPLVRAAVKQCADVLVPLTKGLPIARSAAYSASSAADSARSAAYSASSAADSAASSASSAADSARSAAYSARSAAYSASSAADSARSAAYSAYSAADSAASSAARSAAWVLMAEKLITLLRAA